MQVNIHPSWQKVLQSEFDQPYFEELVHKVKLEYQSRTVFPAPKNIFRAFDLTPFEDIKVVILGQDPYHTAGVADGLAFSTLPNNPVPPSLRNIYKEIATEFNCQPSTNPDLTRLANQGVLLLNTSLTVRQGEANSHSKFGWSTFTDAVIKIIAQQKSNVVFILWGGNARLKSSLIKKYPNNGHLVLESAHPSPLSAHNGFWNNGHFATTNQFLTDHNQSPIQW